jgi:acetyl esterase/lipase
MSQAQKESIEAMLREVPIDAGGDLDLQRPLFEEFLRQQPLPEDMRLKDETLGGAPIVKLVAPGAVADRRILYFHGGVFAFGSARSGAGLAGPLARQARAAALSVRLPTRPGASIPSCVR